MSEYFSGWYLKCRSDEGALALIPAFHEKDGRRFFSIQLITEQGTFYHIFPYEKARGKGSRLRMRIGESIFCENGIFLKLEEDGLEARGWLRFGQLRPIRYDIMGPFCLVPFMECRHTVLSMCHRVDGRLTVNGRDYIFHNGTGYIEGDRGSSFPAKYVWTQCFFGEHSLMLSVAEIPMGRVSFTGIIGVILWRGKEYRLATYLGARILEMEPDKIVIGQGRITFTARLLKQNAQPLYAPKGGQMSRVIRESLCCRASYSLKRGGQMLFAFESMEASFEYEWPLVSQ